MVLFVSSICTAGLVPALLRYYKISKEVYKFYYLLSTFIILLALVIVGFFPSNPLNLMLNLRVKTISDSIIISMSVICSLIFIFNRGLQTAKESFGRIVISVLVILILRIVALAVSAIFKIENINVILLLICVIPFIYDIYLYLKELVLIKKYDLSQYFEFILYCFKISLAGVIFILTSRLYLISSKSYDSSLAASLSFAASFTGVISILNTTFTSYFIGKLDHRNYIGIAVYLKKIKDKALLFILLSVVVSVLVSLFVKIIYPENSIQAAVICLITVFQSAVVSYIGMVTLLAKTFNLVHLQILLNLLCYILVFMFVNLFAAHMSEYVAYMIVNFIMLMNEALLAMWVIKRIKSSNTGCNDRIY